jgi:hypothetical protein
MLLSDIDMFRSVSLVVRRDLSQWLTKPESFRRSSPGLDEIGAAFLKSVGGFKKQVH